MFESNGPDTEVSRFRHHSPAPSQPLKGEGVDEYKSKHGKDRMGANTEGKGNKEELR